jgi:UDP-GlcNAc:undecaprenyl-phosphate GlcNAc-1-phosphate transferase
MSWLTSSDWAVCSAFVLSFLCTGFSIPVAYALGILDRPGVIKIHANVTPRFGGLGIVVGLLASVLALRLMPMLAVAGLAAIALTGALDDKFSIKPTQKLAGETVSGVLLGAAFLHGHWGAASIPLALVLVVVLANAVNLIDGLNGLAAGYTTIAAAGFALVMMIAGLNPAVAAALSLAALGFLLWNFPRARTFMGDVGSLGIGYCLAYLLLSIAQQSGAALVSALPLLAIPVCDMVLGIVRRWIRGRPILQGDRDHFYDVLNRKLGNATVTTLVVYGLSLLFLGLGLFSTRISISAALGIYAAILVGLIPLSLQAGFLPRRRGYRVGALPELIAGTADDHVAAAGGAEEAD